MMKLLKSNLTELAMNTQAFLFPRIHVGPYVFVRKHVVILLQGMVEYDFCGITKDSVVLDIGASVGGFTVMAAKRCRHVYAVEPLHAEILRENLKLNNINNCTVLEYAVGDRDMWEKLSYGRITKTVHFVTLNDILKMIPEKIDFMKCDIEGGEIYVDFSLFQNIEAELHEFDEHGNLIRVYPYHKRNGCVL
jgi:FkbM family methyltransferase